MKHFHFDISVTLFGDSLQESYAALTKLMGDTFWQTNSAQEEDPETYKILDIDDDELYRIWYNQRGETE